MLQIAPHNVSTSVSTSADQQVSLLALLTSVLRARRLVVRCAIAAATLVAAVTVTKPREFVSTAGVTVQGGRAPSSLSGLAAQFGVNVGGGDATASPAFVAKLLGAPELLRHLAMDTLRMSDAAPVAVASLYEGPAGESRARQTDRVATALAKDLRVAAEAETGVIRVRTSASSAAIAAALTSKLLTLGDSTLVARRQKSASADAQYGAAQAAAAKASLRDAEASLQAFLSGNRQATAPRLLMEQQRLQRDVSAREALANALAQSAQQARLEAERPTSVLGMVEPPSLPSMAEPRGLLSKLVLGSVGGALLGACIGLFLASLARQAGADRSTGSAFARESQEAWTDLTRPWRLLSASRGTTQPESDSRAA